MPKVATYKGKPIDEMTREELIEAIDQISNYYELRLADRDRTIKTFDGFRKFKQPDHVF